MGDVSVLIPYSYRTDWEHRLFEFAVERWIADFPGWEVVVGDGGYPFNRSRARNDAAAHASGDLFIICDADTTYTTREDVAVVVNQVRGGCGWSLPRSYLQATEDWTLRTVGGAFIDKHIEYTKEYKDQPGGWRVCSADAFRSVGGFDVGFKGWGYEDTAFESAMTTIHGKALREATAIHLWHPTSRGERQEQPHIRSNFERFSLYRQAQSAGPEKMVKLLKELKVLE